MDAGPRQAQLMFRIAASVPLAWHRAKAMVRLAQQACLPRMRPLSAAPGPGWTATRASQAACLTQPGRHAAPQAPQPSPLGIPRSGTASGDIPGEAAGPRR
jgi:hypothetical protein